MVSRVFARIPRLRFTRSWLSLLAQVLVFTLGSALILTGVALVSVPGAIILAGISLVIAALFFIDFGGDSA